MARTRLTRAESQEQTRQHLLDAAEELFRKRGLFGTTVGQIAQEAGYTPGALYSNFEGKEDLALAVLARSTQESAAKLADELPADGDFIQRLVAIVRWRQHLLAENAPLGVLRLELALQARRDKDLRAQLAARQQRLRAFFADLLVQQVEEFGGELTADAEMLAAMVLSVADGTAIASQIEPDGPYIDSFTWALAAITSWVEPSPVPDGDWSALARQLAEVARAEASGTRTTKRPT